MDFDWDEGKREEIWEERGVDLLRAARMFNDPENVEIWEDPRDYGEKRFNAIGLVKGVWYEPVFAERGV